MVVLDEINIQETSINKKSITLIFFFYNISNQPSDERSQSNFQDSTLFL